MTDARDGSSGKPSAPKVTDSVAPTEPEPMGPESLSGAPTEPDPHGPNFVGPDALPPDAAPPDAALPDAALPDAALPEVRSPASMSEVPAPKSEVAPAPHVATTLKSDRSEVADVLAAADARSAAAAGKAGEGATAPTTDLAGGPSSTSPASTSPASTSPASASPVSSSPASSSPASASPASSSPASASPASASPESQPSVLQVLAPHLTEEQEAARRKDKMRGLIIIGVTFVACILLSLWGKKAAEPMESEPPRAPTTVGLVGWPNAVNVEETLPVARHTTPREQLRGFVAERVKPDGTIDFKDKQAMVRFSFQSGPGKGPQPALEPGAVPRRSYCGKQNIYIRSRGLVADPDVAHFPCGATQKEPLPDPQCTLKQLWDFMTQKRGAPQGTPARIEYYMSKVGPAYRFSLPGTKHRVSLADDCRTVLSSKDGLGGVP